MSRKHRRRLVETTVVQVSPYLRAEKPLLWLCEKDAPSPRLLPIAVGEFEAAALQMGLGCEEPLRPISYDLLTTMLERLDVRLRRVVIHSVKDLVFLATVVIEDASRLREVDARPSDAVALALRSEAPVFVSDELLELAGLSTTGGRSSVEEAVSKFYDLEPQIVDESVADDPTASPAVGELAPLLGDPALLEHTPLAEEVQDVGEIPHPSAAAHRVPPLAKGSDSDTLVQLRSRLQQAVLCEEYEEAAALRDRIRRLVDESKP